MQLDFFTKLTKRVAGLIKTRSTPKLSVKPKSRTKKPVVEKNGNSAEELQKHARALLKSLHYVELADRLKVEWNPRMRSTAGTALAAKSLITLNPRLLEFGAAEVNRTLLHELAHLVAHHRAGRRRISAHGLEWQQACIDLGLKNEKRCHDLPLPRRTMQPRHLYRCPNCGLEVHRVRPLRRKSACIACCRAHSRGKYDGRFQFVKFLRPPGDK